LGSPGERNTVFRQGKKTDGVDKKKSNIEHQQYGGFGGKKLRRKKNQLRNKKTPPAIKQGGSSLPEKCLQWGGSTRVQKNGAASKNRTKKKKIKN